MAKKKNAPIEVEEVIEEIIEEATVEEVEEVIEEVIEEPVEEVKEEVVENKSNQFLYTQLRMINKLNNPAKARRLADRVKRNRKR